MKNKNRILIFIGLTLVAIILGGTFAYYRWVTTDDEVINITAEVGSATVTFDGGSDISATLKPVSDKTLGIVKNISVKGDTEDLVFNMYLDIVSIDEGLKDVSFRYALYNEDTLKSEGNFSTDYLTNNLSSCSTNETNHLTLLEDEDIYTTKATYTLYIWIDGANYTNPSSMMNKNFTFKLHAEGTKAILKQTTAAEYITNLYIDNKDGTVTNNGIEYSIAPSVGLMNDRLGGTTENIDGGNIRYYGANPNNYVWLGDYYTEDMTIERGISEYGSFEECMENEGSSVYCQEDIEVHAGDKKLWRIIGVFDNKLKLVTDNIISTQGLSWDTSESSVNNGYGINEWSQSDLMKLLNPGYEEESVNNSLYWNKGMGTVYTAWRNGTKSNVSFASTGLSEEEKNMIDEAVWYTGAYDNISYADVHYKAEREDMGKICTSGTYCNDTVTRNKEWSGKVGLISASDLGYSVDLNSCNYTLDEYWQDDCALNNWLVNGKWYWTVSPRTNSNYANDVFYVNDNGILYNYRATGVASVRPAVYLKSGVTISSGNGSQSDPYELSYQ